MMSQLYELLWEVVTDVNTSIYREFKVFHSHSEASRYGRHRERELNEGVSIERRALDGYYYKYRFATEVKLIDGYEISLIEGMATRPI